MKKLLLLLLITGAIQFASAQVKEGKITFEQKVDMYRRIPADNAQMRAMVPQFRTMKYDLLFADNQSIFKQVEEEPDMTENDNGGMVIKMRMNGSGVFYKNFNTSKAVDQRELAEKEFIIEDSIKSLTWKLTDDTATVLGYLCKKATAKTERGTDVDAWYTEEIAVPSGPEFFSGLPGMILKASLNKDEVVYTALQLSKTVNKKDVQAPSKGKKITLAEFSKMQKELFGNQNGPVKIVTN